MMVSPPCVSEADRYSLEALRSIHQMMDDDHDGGIEVEESVEVKSQSQCCIFVGSGKKAGAS
jgi:Ca2+-binding EF-hand superfamily protein